MPLTNRPQLQRARSAAAQSAGGRHPAAHPNLAYFGKHGIGAVARRTGSTARRSGKQTNGRLPAHVFAERGVDKDGHIGSLDCKPGAAVSHHVLFNHSVLQGCRAQLCGRMSKTGMVQRPTAVSCGGAGHNCGHEYSRNGSRMQTRGSGQSPCILFGHSALQGLRTTRKSTSGTGMHPPPQNRSRPATAWSSDATPTKTGTPQQQPGS